jgi:aryl-alcohol dehydrogenase-like predicted oxidoreductase
MIIGISLSGPNQSQTLRKALSIELDGAPLFRSVQATWNLLSREATDALSAAHDAGMGVIIKEALANGRLTARNEDPDFAPKRRILADISRELGFSIDALALAAVMAQPWADIVLSGAVRKSHLISNLHALEIAWTDELESRLAAIIEPAEKYWQTRSAMDWN